MHNNETAEAAIALVERTGFDLATLTHVEMALEAERPVMKGDAIRRIMEAGPNPLTGKQHSASSAEAVVETDPAYAAYLKRQREVVRDKIVARAAYEAAKLRAQLAVEAATLTVELVGGEG